MYEQAENREVKSLIIKEQKLSSVRIVTDIVKKLKNFFGKALDNRW